MDRVLATTARWIEIMIVFLGLRARACIFGGLLASTIRKKFAFYYLLLFFNPLRA